MNCRFVSTAVPRIISRRHADPCSCDGEFGCLPCPETHCVICGKEHARAACVGCLDAARSDLHAIGDLCGALPAEAVLKGVDSEAMMLIGPSADTGDWQRLALSAAMGRLCECGEGLCPSLRGKLCPQAAYLEDCRDELHPVWVLGTWEQVWRDHLDHLTEAPFTLNGGWSYLDTQIGYMAEQVEPAFDEFARDLRSCRAHLEDVLRDGIREERGAPCVQCEKAMVRIQGAGTLPDSWECRTCHREVTEDQYRFAVAAAYQAHAIHLTAADLSERIGVKASVIRVWGSRGLVRKRGRNHDGITLYDVADAEARRDLAGEAV